MDEHSIEGGGSAAADDRIAVKFAADGKRMVRTTVFLADDGETAIPITDEEAEILRGLDRYYD